MFCQQTENRPLAGIIVIGEGQSARAVALAGTAMKVPVLWAKGGTASLNGKHKEVRMKLLFGDNPFRLCPVLNATHPPIHPFIHIHPSTHSSY